MTNRIDATNCTHEAALARIAELEAKLDAEQKWAADWKAMAEYNDTELAKVREIARGLQSRLDKITSTLRGWRDNRRIDLYTGLGDSFCEAITELIGDVETGRLKSDERSS
jgi:hypothetical protein